MQGYLEFEAQAFMPGKMSHYKMFFKAFSTVKNEDIIYNLSIGYIILGDEGWMRNNFNIKNSINIIS